MRAERSLIADGQATAAASLQPRVYGDLRRATTWL